MTTNPMADPERGASIQLAPHQPQLESTALIQRADMGAVDTALCVQGFCKLLNALLLPLILYLVYWNHHCDPKVQIAFFLMFGFNVTLVVLQQLLAHIVANDAHKMPADQHPFEMKLILALAGLLAVGNLAFFIWLITLGWGHDAISPNGCVVLTEYIKVIGMFAIIGLSCIGCAACMSVAGAA